MAQRKASYGLGIKVRPVDRRGNCLCKREGEAGHSEPGNRDEHEAIPLERVRAAGTGQQL